MSNALSAMNEDSHPIPLAVVYPAREEDTITTAEEEALPSIEIIPRYPDAKPDLQKPLEVMTEKFQFMMMVRRLTELTNKFGLPTIWI